MASPVMGHWGTCPLDFANARKFCRPNARWLSLLDDFVTTNFGTRAPRARAPLEQNSGDATRPLTGKVLTNRAGQQRAMNSAIIPWLITGCLPAVSWVDSHDCGWFAVSHQPSCNITTIQAGYNLVSGSIQYLNHQRTNHTLLFIANFTYRIDYAL